MKVAVRAPSRHEALVEDVVAELCDAKQPEPFCEEAISFCHELSRALRPHARQHPEIGALAYWIRRSEVLRLRDAYFSLCDDETLLVPRGIVTHFPPANVDTIFAYSWLVAMLAGNKNVVRLSRRESQQTRLILGALTSVLEQPSVRGVRASSVMLGYEPDLSINNALCGACDVRVIWGGDESVRAIRRSPLPPASIDVTFPDRVSFAVIKTDRLLRASPEDALAMVRRFFNDAYWFDQTGCSSPRLVVFVGEPDVSRRAQEEFFSTLLSVVRDKRYSVDTGTALGKISFGFSTAVEMPVERVRHVANELLVLELASPQDMEGVFAGAGTFATTAVASLDEVSGIVHRRYQTLSHYGFTSMELRRLARSLNGSGIDRMVPFGQALTFNRYWDGYDLLQAFSRRVHVRGDPE